MRIGVNTRVLLKDRMEGVARYCYETTKLMVLSHPQDEFIFFFDRPYDPSFIFAQNVTPVVIGPPARHPLLWYYWFEYSLPQALKKNKCDVLYSPDSYLSLSSSIPTVLVSHDLAYLHYPEHVPWLTRKYYQNYMPRFHDRADQIVTVSKASKDDIIKQFGINENKISIAFNGCSSEFKPLSAQEKTEVRDQYTEGSPFFIYVGSIHPRKNISRLIEAFDRFCEKNNSYQLLLVGRWAWKTQEIKVALQKSKHRSSIKVISDHQASVAPLIASAEAMVYVSHHEGFGLPILEALHCETPVITSNVSSMPEVAGKAALIVDPNNSEAIADALFKITKDGLLKEQLVLEGKAQLAKFSWEESATRIYSLIKKVHATTH